MVYMVDIKSCPLFRPCPFSNSCPTMACAINKAKMYFTMNSNATPWPSHANSRFCQRSPIEDEDCNPPVSSPNLCSHTVILKNYNGFLWLSNYENPIHRGVNTFDEIHVNRFRTARKPFRTRKRINQWLSNFQWLELSPNWVRYTFDVENCSQKPGLEDVFCVINSWNQWSHPSLIHQEKNNLLDTKWLKVET